MTSIRTLLVVGGCTLSLAACDFLIARDRDEPAPAKAEESDVSLNEAPAMPDAVETPVVVASTANIDWEAARADLAATPSEDRETGFQVASGGTAPPVPVLLPTGIVVPQGAEGGVRFQPMSDGYFAAYPGIDYDIVVNGTNEVIGIDSADSAQAEPVLTYTPTMTGAQVSFSRYGADYLVEFECKSIEGGEADCITEQEALDVTNKLVIAGTR
ncbi:MAG: hypothetical protein R3265_01510 [Hyphomonas sp.]|nr:hypothetical protein [Hyphomonas sp.]